MSKFKVGDRVRVRNHPYLLPEKRYEQGTVTLADTIGNGGNRGEYTVKLDDYMTLGFEGRELELIQAVNSQKIIITHDGTTVTAAYDGENEKQSATVELGKYAGFPSAAQAAMMKATGIACPPVPKPDMSAERRALADKICEMGMCSARSSNRKKDCPFYRLTVGRGGCSSYAADHPETQKMMEDYLAAEQDKPAEPAPEPIKLYCVKDFPERFTKGKVYQIGADGYMENYDFGCKGVGCYRSFEAYQNDLPHMAACLVPLVKRPAKVGEWVYITEGTAKGIIGEVLHIDHAGVPLVRHRDVWGMFADQNGMELTRFSISQYLVLDGYQPEPAKPEYWSGKLVCIDNAGLRHWTVGKIYVVIGGIIRDDDDCSRKGIKGPNAIPSCILAKFVEYKGEASA